jgi:hypothetical protein
MLGKRVLTGATFVDLALLTRISLYASFSKQICVMSIFLGHNFSNVIFAAPSSMILFAAYYPMVTMLALSEFVRNIKF